MISVRLIIHNTYVILRNEIVGKFTSGIIVLTTPEDIVTIKVTEYDIGRRKLIQLIVQVLEAKRKGWKNIYRTYGYFSV